MILTVSLLNKGSFLGSLINKCRQVLRIKTVNKLESNLEPKIYTSITTSSTTSTPTFSSPQTTATTTSPASSSLILHNTKLDGSDETNRPTAVANISTGNPTYVAKTLEERAGLPPKPKKPLTPYFRFMIEQRPKMQAANPKLSVINIVKQISEQWKTVDASYKQRLQEEYKKDQQKYVETRTRYDSKITDEQRLHLKEIKQELIDAKERRMMRKRIKDLGRPKKPASAFLRFIAKERFVTPQKLNETYREWHARTTAKWGTLTDDQKYVYIMEARKEIEKYKKEVSSWEEKMIRIGHIDVVRHSNLIDPPEPKAKKH